jgi:hypothetical protein
MTLYRKRPIVVEAFQWQPDVVTMDNKQPLPDWLLDKCVVVAGQLEVFTPTGVSRAVARDWIVKEREALWVITPHAFEAAYELIKE